MILTMSHWSSGLTCLLPATRVTGSNPQGDLSETGFLLLALTRYIGDPDVIDHQQGFAPPTVTRPSCRQCDSPTWSHTAFLSPFHARCRSPFWLHNRRSQLLGGSPVKSLQSHIILTMSHWSSGLTCLLPATRVTGSNPLGDLSETGILLLAMSRYTCLQHRWCHVIPYSSDTVSDSANVVLALSKTPQIQYIHQQCLENTTDLLLQPGGCPRQSSY